ncbi:hypothetical protein AHAS_Ahas15G0171300 [Arachis hypogaea]
MTMKEKAHYNKTHYCRCQTKAIATVYREMSQEKKDIVEEMGFGALENVPKMNVSNTLLKELLDRFDEEKGCLKTVQEKIYITPRKVAAALGITNGGKIPRKARATPDSDLQIVEFQQQTRSQLLEVYPQELEKQGVTVSLTSSVIEDLFKDDYVYEVSNEDPTKEQQQQAQEPLVQQQSEQEAPVNPCEEPTAQQSEQEAPVDVCLSEPIKQGVTGSLTSSVIEEFFKDADVYEVSDEEKSQEPLVAWQSKKETLILSSFDSAAQPRQRENERPSFSLGISPPASQPTQPSQERVSQLEILAKAVVDAGVAAALKFAEATSSKSNLPAAKVVSIHSMILNQIKVQQYQEQIYIVPLDIVYIDKRTNKAYRFDIEQYAHHRQFLDKRKLASHPFLFVPICNGEHWWLWIADVNKKKFYVLDPINKLPENIPYSRKQLNKFINLIISQMRVYAGAQPLIEDGLGEEVEYIRLNSQRTNYDCGIYKEIDDFRYQHGPNLLLHEMKEIRDQVIWEYEAIRLSKPSPVLSSPYYKFTYGDLNSK